MHLNHIIDLKITQFKNIFNLSRRFGHITTSMIPTELDKSQDVVSVVCRNSDRPSAKINKEDQVRLVRKTRTTKRC